MSVPARVDPPGTCIDHVRFYVHDLEASVKELVTGYGMEHLAEQGADAGRTVAVGAGRIRLLLTEPSPQDTRGRSFLDRHGDGAADIALRVPDAAEAHARAAGGGARSIAEPVRQGDRVTAVVSGFGDVVHSLVQYPPGRAPGPRPGRSGEPDLQAIDHVAVCLEPGSLDSTAAFYEAAFGLRPAFSDRTVVGGQAMRSTAVQHPERAVTFTLLEPDPGLAPGQIDEFLAGNRGPGVQHLALGTPNIVEAVGRLTRRSVGFLGAPDAYYRLLSERIRLCRHSTESLRELGVLVDADQDGLLFQIFARSTHPRGTYFFELVERCGARTFGGGNIRALYEALAADQAG